ncbi:TPA: Spx/MgsR family RNA polymerase-binding regulatory protein [Candidatus Woesearchaeota archaeon]|nr:ArsC family transcriptional regulator [archaeon]HIJ11420.1 Spx/MgsR family RNA polymerase-binding regulatory protein [Candidatus Woesearchaeota archaeon]|tara:strand:- start:205 stop:540 length:336 start_codon:yes stop_codon:yes gene_type:complete
MKLYIYKGCGTCQKALKYLNEKNIQYTTIPIREQPPTLEEIKTMYTKYGLKRLFNTSGQDYRKLNMKEKLQTMTDEEALILLSKNGNLIKRPFTVNPFLVGFKEDEWDNVL